MGFWNEAKRGWNFGVHSQRGIDALKEEQWTTAAYEFTEALKYCDPNEERIDVWKRRYLAYFNPPGVDRDLMRKARADIISIRNAKESALTDHMRYAEAFCAYALDLYDEAIPLALLAIDQNSTTQFNSQLRDLIQKSLDERDGTGAAIQRAQTAMGEGLWEFAASEYTNALQNCTSDRDRIRVWKQRYRAYWNSPGADRELMRKARADILAVRGADASELTDHMRYAQAFCAYMLDMYDEAISSARYALTNNSTTEYDSQLGDVIKKSQDERGSASIVKRQNEALGKGVDAMDKERWDEAVNHFTEALDLERNDEDKAKILQLRVKANWTPAGAQKLDLFRRVHTDLQWIRRLTGKPLDEHQSYMSAFSLYFIDEYDDAIGEIRAALPRTTDSELQQRLLDILDKCHKEKESKKARDTMKLGIAAHNSEEYEKAAGLYTRALSQTKDLKLRMEIIHFRMMSYWVPASLQKLDLFRKAHADIQTLRSLDPDLFNDRMRYQSICCLYALDEYEECLKEGRNAMSYVEDEDLLSSITKILQLCNSEQENAQKARAAEAKKRADEEDREKRRKNGFSVAAAANRGAQAYKEGDYARAIDILSDALEFPCADTLKASILSNRAHAHFKLHNPKDRYDDGHLTSALSDCDRVAELASTPHYKTILLAGMILVSQADYDAAVSKGKKALACSSGREEEEKAMDFLNSAMAARINSRRSSDGPRRPPEPTPEEARILEMLEEMSLKTPHEILGVKPGATRVEIVAAYHVLAKQYHPDKPGGDTRLFQRLDTAKRTLCP